MPDYDWFSGTYLSHLASDHVGVQLQLQLTPYHAHFNSFFLNLPHITVIKTNLTYENHLLLFRSKGVRVITP